MDLRSSLLIFFLVLAAFLFTSCGTAPPVEMNMTPAGSDAGPALQPVSSTPALPTAEPLPGEYPPEPAAQPVPPTYPPDYPAPPTFVPLIDPYPGGLVWIVRPVGIQCESGTAPGYGDLRESVATLTAAGLHAVDSEMAELAVANSCGSPTSAHYRVQIDVDELDSALSMGWQREGFN